MNGQIRVFDEIHESDKLEEFIIRYMLMKRPWFELILRGKAKCVAVIDRAGATRAGAHEASIEVYRKVSGLNLLYTEKVIPISDQIRRFNKLLEVNGITGEPGIVIDTKCEGLLSELGGTLNRRIDPPQLRAYQWNLNAQGIMVGDVPRDRYNDAIKAITYAVCHQWGFATVENPRTLIRVIRRRDRRRRAA